MERGQQLLDIMNEVSARLDHAPIHASPVRVLDEMQAFMALDPLLADLHKQYMDAKGARLSAEKDYGRNDGMTDMTMMMEDSAWCAMQTRYMELRGDRRMMSQAQQSIENSRRAEEEQAAKKKTRDALKLIDQMLVLMQMRELQEAKTKRETSTANWFLFLMFILHENDFSFRAHHPSYSFNRLAA